LGTTTTGTELCSKTDVVVDPKTALAGAPRPRAPTTNNEPRAD
jgi:hypothetical protein